MSAQYFLGTGLRLGIQRVNQSPFFMEVSFISIKEEKQDTKDV